MENNIIVLKLPWAPSVNKYWLTRGNRKFLSKRGREYKEDVYAIFLESKQRFNPLEFFESPLKIRLECIPPDRRKRDLDNLLKAILDALQNAGLVKDDSQFVDIHIIKSDKIEKHGCIIATITINDGEKE